MYATNKLRATKDRLIRRLDLRTASQEGCQKKSYPINGTEKIYPNWVLVDLMWMGVDDDNENELGDDGARRMMGFQKRFLVIQNEQRLGVASSK